MRPSTFLGMSDIPLWPFGKFMNDRSTVIARSNHTRNTFRFIAIPPSGHKRLTGMPNLVIHFRVSCYLCPARLHRHKCTNSSWGFSYTECEGPGVEASWKHHSTN
jgi:hypothetical protein